MAKRILLLCLFALATSRAALAAEEPSNPGQPAALSVEQQLYNDFAARLEQHFHKTAAILAKIRQTTDAQERQKLVNEYAQAMQTTHKVNQAMMAFAGKPSGMAGGKKMGKGMMGGGGCKMMKQHAASAQGADDAAAGEADEGDQEPTSQAGGHEGH
jgi:hypothetical protein